LRTNCRAAASMSASATRAFPRRRVLMLRHMVQEYLAVKESAATVRGIDVTKADRMRAA
jgi:hypothetical protein